MSDRVHRCSECDTPTPRLKSKTDHLLMTTLRDMGETAREVTETVATDGGGNVDELADELGKHPATIYRAIEDLEELCYSDRYVGANAQLTFNSRAQLVDRFGETQRDLQREKR